ncbi:hypothetical protein [Lysinibacillus fusiformis]|uniref:hypothetical protein n=1 Tax=Lysinibacillus TaxID=400634 RepID=UPI0019684B64|nr:hypothetical protein [Lysinibacillus fusiformis]QSB09685.1 hypothetical protein JTI58_22345 [Lysinibacillus fusiformis]
MSIIICPYCKAEDGFYVKERITGTATIHYTELGDYAEEQSSMYDYLNHSGGKIAYCAKCEKSLGKAEKLKSGISEEDRRFSNNSLMDQ